MRRLGLALATALLALAGESAAVRAEEAPPFDLTKDGPRIIDNLKATPATLYDLAIARLEARLAALGVAHKFMAHANYQDDRVMIYAYDFDRAVTVEGCRQIFDAIRRDAGIDLATGYALDPASVYASLFSFPRIREFEVSQTYAETMDAIITIKVVLGVTGDGQGLVCDGPLLGKDFTHKAD
jgi:hypothetical protein